MMRIICLALVGWSCLGLAQAQAQTRPLDTITLDCVFERQTSLSIESDGKPLAVTQPEKPLLTTITGLDAKAGTATMVGNLGSVPLIFFADGTRWMFIQITDTGNATLTSMLDPTKSGEAYAVHSRHIWFSGEAVISQWGGTCRVR